MASLTELLQGSRPDEPRAGGYRKEGGKSLDGRYFASRLRFRRHRIRRLPADSPAARTGAPRARARPPRLGIEAARVRDRLRRCPAGGDLLGPRGALRHVRAARRRRAPVAGEGGAVPVDRPRLRACRRRGGRGGEGRPFRLCERGAARSRDEGVRGRARGHRWPYFLLPGYWLLEKLPPTREGARRLGLVTLAQMVSALVRAAEDPARGIRIVDVPGIRAAERS